MAGVVAMASVIEDFDTQSCKKARKDVNNPVVKTITNYFSPVAKPAEKPFSPPRSNKIMDYFSRKGPSPTNRVSSPKQRKENCMTNKHTSPGAAPKQPAQKRGRKASKTARKLLETSTSCPLGDVSSLVVGDSDSKGSCGVLGSDTAILLGQVCAESAVSSETSQSNSGGSYQQKKGPDPCGSHVKTKQDLKGINISPILPSKDKYKKVRTAAGNSKKKKQLDEKSPESEVKETEKSLCDISTGVNVGDDSQLNDSTVTISFDDFVRSQSQDESTADESNELGEQSQSRVTIETEQRHIPNTEENGKLSPQTITVQAEVHAVSHGEEAKQAGKTKKPSIFTKIKGTSPVETTSSPQTEAGHQSSPRSSKWKSNVVLAEKDIELAVLESASTLKCSQAERKQFMAAFKQPSLDCSKTKPGKIQGKQKQPGDKTADDAGKSEVNEEEAVVQSTSEKSTAALQDNREPKKKLARKRQKVAKEEKDGASLPADAAMEETEIMIVDSDDNREEQPTTSTPSVPLVRRSKREAVVRKTSKTTELESPPSGTCRPDTSKDTAASNQNSPSKVSTTRRRKSKRGVFKAELVCPPDAKESPIRIKFTKVHHKVENANTASTPLVKNIPKDSKKTKQAKKLLAKAKAMKQNKSVPAEEKKTLRRSSRTDASMKRSYCEDEDSVICVEEIQTTTPQSGPEKGNSQKALRSLNDVLGKTAPNKDTKVTSGSRVCQEKASQKTPVVVSIFDDSSHEGSENSQDDEQFRARREFLKSGLPESFKKQMAKTAATKDTHVLSCSSLQPVIHVTQPPNDCPFWNLSWPKSSILCNLKESWCQLSSPPLINSGLLKSKTVPVCRALSEKVSGWRPEISTCVRELLMEEISTSNPPFPVQKFMSHFLKRRAELSQCTASEPDAVSKVSCSKLAAEDTGGKRKRIDEEEEMAKVSKKQRGSRLREKQCTPTTEKEPAKRERITRRGQKSVSKEEEVKSEAEPSQKTDSAHSEDNAVIVLDSSPSGQNTVKPDVVKEDVLWTEKYQPQHSSEVIGNTTSVRRLHSWLKEWKLRADKDDRKKQKDKKQEEGSIDSDWDCGEEDSPNAEDRLCNTVLITGPTGVGKTAAVYACAQELGFKVFEVNASCQRSGRLILSQLKEATQSHQVDSQGVNAHKPTYFNSYSTSSSTVRPGSSPRKVNSPRSSVSSPRKRSQSPRAAKRGGLTPTALAKFFKMAKPGNKEQTNTKDEQIAVPKKIAKPNEGDSNKTSVRSPVDALPKNLTEEQSKKTATSLILFEEVDVIFEDDTGFLSAIKTFMTTTKRPVILTTSDPAFSAVFDGKFEEIVFETPTVLNVASYLQLLCLAEDMRTDLKDIKSLLSVNGCDIRKTLLQLQFWTRSGGGQRRTSPPAHSGQKELTLKSEDAVTDMSVCVMSDLPPLPLCDAGCTESMLGLLNIEPQRNIWQLLKSPSLWQDGGCSDLLTASMRQGVDLLYSNMETLLPLPLTALTVSNPKPLPTLPLSQDQPSTNPQVLQSEKLPSHTEELADFSDDASPIKVSNRMKKNKRRQCLPEKGGLQSDSNSEDDFLSLKQQKSASQETVKVNVPEKVTRKPLTPEEQTKSVPVSQCLHSFADFLDTMSFVDLLSSEGRDVHQRIHGGAVVKDGLTDESRIETEKGSLVTVECASEISAAVQSLSFSKCHRSVTDAWEKVQQLDKERREEATVELTLPVASHHESCSFTQHSPCQPQLVQRRREIIEELMRRGTFGSVGNRPAVAQDYLPALRTICISELLKEQGKVKRRFLHYLDAVHLGLQKCTLQYLAEEFP